jgi:hypothetical protein
MGARPAHSEYDPHGKVSRPRARAGTCDLLLGVYGARLSARFLYKRGGRAYGVRTRQEWKRDRMRWAFVRAAETLDTILRRTRPLLFADVDFLGAVGVAHLAVDTVGPQASVSRNGRSKEGIETAQETDQSSQGTNRATPSPKDHELDYQDRREKDKFQTGLLNRKEPSDGKEGAEKKADGTDETKDGKPEESG